MVIGVRGRPRGGGRDSPDTALNRHTIVTVKMVFPSKKASRVAKAADIPMVPASTILAKKQGSK